MNARRWLSSLSVLLTVLSVLLAAGFTHAQEPNPLEGPENLDEVTNFDGDAYADLAIGVPYENVSAVTDAGSVSVVYGSSTGLTGTADEYWQQNYLNGSNVEDYEYFGRALAVGDFNGDGYHDLAVGVPNEDVGSVKRAGAVNVIYGSSAGGLDVSGNQYWTQGEPGMGDAAEEDDYFGYSLTSGDFNGDGYHDLAVGIPYEDIGTIVNAGGMQVLYGSASGLTAGGVVWNQEDAAEIGDLFGWTLVAADFNDDGFDELAVGVSNEDLGSITDAGAVQIYYGSSGGLTERVSNDFWHQDRSGVADTADEYDAFGSSLTAGDFNGDGFADLAIGIPYEDVGSPSISNAGAVNILFGSNSGITSDGSEYWHQDSLDVGSLCEENDFFGYALSAADFDNDSFSDLAVGLPYEDWDDPNTGIVQVFYGTVDGLSADRDQIWRQDVTNIEGGEEAEDRFGFALAAGDFDGDDYLDLAIGVPYEDIETTEDAGAVNIIFGSDSGLTAADDQIWYQGYNGLQGTPELGDKFGYSLAALPFKQGYEVYLPLILK